MLDEQDPKKRKATNPIADGRRMQLNTADGARANEAALKVLYKSVLPEVFNPDPAFTCWP